ncbi:lipopolysaccharide biosynthesis protein [Pedobacter foliorum]|uniref:lipopolysaccharide biosynthesis protein n=1 Tax=Pedobacter foliorum TaxID=2739058 RepID=UPI00156445F1|nr:oligosaccharide flippase family protein [Pedobacter foliorum]NRF38218.1 oligosaccharide flippase family protein [Pedobacter foliorum]
MSDFINSLKSKVQNKHFLSLTGNAVMSILGVVTYSLLYHSLSLDAIGIWIFFITGFSLLDTFRSGFLTIAFIKFYSGSSESKQREVIGSTWYIAILITIGFILLNIPAFLLEKYVNDTGFSMLLKWFGLTYILTLPFYIASNIAQGEQRFDRLLYIRVINTGSFIGFVALLIFLKKNTLDNILYAYLTSSLLTSTFTLIFGWCKLSYLKNRSKESNSQIYNFGKFSVGTTLSASLFKTTDTIIIKVFLGDAALAIYNLGVKLLEVIEIPLRSFIATAIPILSSSYNQKRKQEVIQSMSKFIGMLTIGLIPVAILSLLFADLAIYIIGGSKYINTEAANVLRLFMTFALLFPADRFFALTIDVIHRPKVNFIKILVMLAANLVFDFVGVKLFGNVYGIALGSIVPSVIAVVVGYKALQSYSKFSFWSIFPSGYKDLRTLIKSVKF